MNQIVSSNYVAEKMQIPFVGIYAACSTTTLGFIVASKFLENATNNNIITFTSSHNGSAERQEIAF